LVANSELQQTCTRISVLQEWNTPVAVVQQEYVCAVTNTTNAADSQARMNTTLRLVHASKDNEQPACNFSRQDLSELVSTTLIGQQLTAQAVPQQLREAAVSVQHMARHAAPAAPAAHPQCRKYLPCTKAAAYTACANRPSDLQVGTPSTSWQSEAVLQQ
jgi:hypothetical protein